MLQSRDKIINRSPMSGLLFLAIPAVFSSLFYIIFEIVDMFWVGRLGAYAVAALSAGSFYVWMLRALAQTVATGALAMVARRSGEMDKQGVVKTASAAIISSVILSIITMIVFSAAAEPVFRLIGIEKSIAENATKYAQIFLSGMLFVYLMVTEEHIIRGMGNTRVPMMITGFSLLLNAGLDPIFIFHFKMGFQGAAVATVISHAVGSVLMTIALFIMLPDLKKNRYSLNRDFFKKYFFPMVKIGAPVSFSNTMFAAVYLVLAGIISHFGSDPLAAIGIGHRIESLPYFVAFGFAMGTATMVGQNLGAGQPQKAKESVFLALKLVSAILLLASVIFFFFPGYFYRFFINDIEVINYGKSYLKFIAVFEVFLALEVVLEGAFSGAGDTKPPMIIIFSLTLLRIPLAWFFSIALNLGVWAVWAVISATTFFKGILMLFWFNKGRWMEKKV
ncbi:MATE family efflux transporter [bacterium]|nr:MATE family efflux transporter [bacterium]